MSRPAVDAFLAAADAAEVVLGAPEVAKAWAGESALDGFTVGGLAGHLFRATRRLELLLDDPEPGDERLVGVAEYYGAVKVESGSALDDDVLRRIRDDGEAAGAEGPEAVADGFRALVARLRERLPGVPPERRVVTLTVPGGATLLDDYMATRVVELVVHTDDLAVSVGMDRPPLPAPAAETALATLLTILRGRHGDSDVLRALTRRERVPEGLLHVF